MKLRFALNDKVLRVKLIVFSGLPGTGKTTLAEAMGREIGIPVFAFDWLMSVIVPHDILPSNQVSAEIGYGLLTRLAERQLMLGAVGQSSTAWLD